MALLATGLAKDSEPILQADEWLANHKNLEFPEGIPKVDPDQWHRVLVIYHLWVRSEVCQAMAWSEMERQSIYQKFVEMQASDGSFSNPDGARNKEDDPLLATAMGVMGMNLR